MMSGSPEVIAAAMLAAFVVGLAKGGLANAGVIAVPIMSLVMPPIAAAALLLPVYQSAFGSTGASIADEI